MVIPSLKKLNLKENVDDAHAAPHQHGMRIVTAFIKL
jgi:hypothetical protein